CRSAWDQYARAPALATEPNRPGTGPGTGPAASGPISNRHSAWRGGEQSGAEQHRGIAQGNSTDRYVLCCGQQYVVSLARRRAAPRQAHHLPRCNRATVRPETRVRGCAVANGTTSRTLTFGALLKRHRRSAGLTQEALAERAGYSVGHISRLERAAR